MYPGSIYNSEKKMQEFKLIVWLYDITTVGLGSYSLMISFIDGINFVEKLFIFLAFLTLAIYRISILHEERAKKKMDNEARRMELDKMREEFKKLKQKITNTKN